MAVFFFFNSDLHREPDVAEKNRFARHVRSLELVSKGIVTGSLALSPRFFFPLVPRPDKLKRARNGGSINLTRLRWAMTGGSLNAQSSAAPIFSSGTVRLAVHRVDIQYA